MDQCHSCGLAAFIYASLLKYGEYSGKSMQTVMKEVGVKRVADINELEIDVRGIVRIVESEKHEFFIDVEIGELKRSTT